MFNPKIIFSISCKFLQKCWFDLLQVVLMIYKEKKKINKNEEF